MDNASTMKVEKETKALAQKLKKHVMPALQITSMSDNDLVKLAIRECLERRGDDGHPVKIKALRPAKDRA